MKPRFAFLFPTTLSTSVTLDGNVIQLNLDSATDTANKVPHRLFEAGDYL